ncbi:hypothetical protein CYY_008350 [Polysphondylium violaceum]|uniref:Uncharacterized protein n=1 Tax=Polysphondylium violaceum TaxID=133409 RepID=A0A8J4UXD4_9MYCE|nr:hypothetical protein CYY_008350 [Polysphondylium violaceum]
MIIECYRSVFNNKYLAAKIFDTVHEIQGDRYALRYDDIVDVGWMLKHGHLALAREKIQNSKSNNIHNSNRYLYVSPEDLFSIVANTDTQMFMSLFEQNKYEALKYYELLEAGFAKLVNVDVFKYLFENGYGRDLDDKLLPQSMDIKVLAWLLENRWFRPTPTWLIMNKKDHADNSDDSSDYTLDIQTTNYTKEFVDLVARFTPSPIQHADIQAIVTYMLEESRPCYLIYDALSPLFVENPEIGIELGKGLLNYQQALEEIQAKRDCQKKIETNISSSSISELLVLANTPGYRIERKMGIYMWSTCISQGEHVFLRMWDALSKRIRVTEFSVYLGLTNDINDMPEDELEMDDDLVGISDIIVDTACEVGALKILDFLMAKGLTQPVYFALMDNNQFLDRLMDKTLSQEECNIVLRISGGPDEDGWLIDKSAALSSCCVRGNANNFNSLYPLFKQGLGTKMDYPVRNLYPACIQSGQYHMIKVLQDHSLFLSAHKQTLFLFCKRYPFRYLLQDIDRYIAKQQGYCGAFYNMFLEWAINQNDLVAVKHIFTQHKFDSIPSRALNKLPELQNLAIIDYINRNRSQCFTAAAAGPTNNVFGGLLEPSKLSSLNIPLLEYLINENCTGDVNVDHIIPFFARDSQIEPGHSFHQIVYLIDHRNYVSIDPFIPILVDSPDWSQCFEYIYRNQHRFQTKPSFQSIFDYIVANLTGEDIQESLQFDKLYALVHRYKCVLNDSHYQHLTLFGIVPNSNFLSNDYHQPKKQKKENE